MDMTKNGAETTGSHIKPFLGRDNKIRRAEGDRVKAKQQRQSRLPVNHTAFTSFPCIFTFTRHRLDEMNKV